MRQVSLSTLEQSRGFFQIFALHTHVCFIHFLCSNFVQSKWGMEEFMIADAQMVNGRKDFLIVILKERMNMDKLPPELRTYLSEYQP